MVTTYGSFPGVRVEVAGGGITAIAIGEEEKLVIFGAANYRNDGDFSTPADGEEDPLVSTLTGTPEQPEQINARSEADSTFGSGSELADAMREALANGANIDFLYGVAPKRYNAIDETIGTQTGTLANAPLWEDNVTDGANITNIVVEDTNDPGNPLDVTFSYDGAPSAPATSDTIDINPLTGEFAADAAPAGSYEFDYKYLDWSTAFGAGDVATVVDEDETGIFLALSEADSVSASLQGEISTLRGNYQLVNGLSAAEPNDSSAETLPEPRYDTANYSTANQSVDADYYFKVAPVRLENSTRTILGGVGGLFAGNPISDPIYNDALTGYSALDESFTKTDADNMRNENIIPIRQAGTIRVKDNLSTSTETDWERDFWRRRIADRVVLIAKTIGDTIVGRINDEQTRDAAARLIRSEIRELVDDRLLKANTANEQNWFVDVYEDSTNPNEVNIDIGFTPYGIVKRIDANIVINT